MTTSVFMLLRWALTFGVPLAIAAHQLILLRRDEERKMAAVAVRAE